MTTFEKCCAIRRMILNRAAEVMAYENWSEEFAAGRIRNLPKDLAEKETGKDYFGIQPAEMTDEQLNELGFGRWGKKTPIRLIPLWLMPFLADEIEVECIDGRKLTRKSQMDNDNRFGCLAYGVIPSDVAIHFEGDTATAEIAAIT